MFPLPWRRPLGLSPKPASLQVWLVAALLVAGYFCLPWRWVETVENITIDFRHQAAFPRPPSDDIVILGIADSAFSIAERAPQLASADPLLAAMSAGWPWDRRVFAAVTEKLAAADARAIVFDVVLAAPGPGTAEFGKVLRRPGPPVVLAGLFSDQHTGEGELTATWIEPSGELVGAPRVSVGFANLWPDHDGIVRHGRATASLSWLIAGAPGANDPDRQPALAYAAAAGAKPAPRDGYIAFRGPAGSFPIIPVEHLFLPDRWSGALAGGERFRGRIVLVGPISEIRFKDYHATPFGRMSGVEVQANVVSTLLGRGPLLRWGTAATGTTVLALALAAALLAVRLRRATALVVALAATGVMWLAATWLLFHHAGQIAPVVAPLGALLGVGGLGLGLRYTLEERERRRLRRLLGSYVSEQVAEVIARQPGPFDAALRGERRDVAVMFADIRGFTSLVEQAAPETIVAQLNEYLHAAVDCVLVSRGTLQKFIGDAFLAVWGDTHVETAAADSVHAVDTALRVNAALAQLNAGWRQRPDRRPLSIGIGIHHGTAMVGNVGHPQRMEFTVLGDAVNIAARLEAANRIFGTTVLVGDAAERLTRESFHYLPVARVVVKGRTQPIAVFTPVGRAGEAPPSWLAGYRAAYAALEQRQFADAARRFEALSVPTPEWQPLVAFQHQLARDLAAEDPPRWCGHLTLDTK